MNLSYHLSRPIEMLSCPLASAIKTRLPNSTFSSYNSDTFYQSLNSRLARSIKSLGYSLVLSYPLVRSIMNLSYLLARPIVTLSCPLMNLGYPRALASL